MTPLAYMDLNTQITRLMLDTQTVMTLRLMGMSGAIPALRGENELMVAEKAPAMADAYAAGAKAAMSGRSPDQIISAVLAPISKKVRANRLRLMK